VGVREAKARLSELLRQVERGGEWTITERGRPVARLVPVPRRETVEEWLERMRREGRSIPPPAGARWPEPLHLPGQVGERLMQVLLEDRENGW